MKKVTVISDIDNRQKAFQRTEGGCYQKGKASEVQHGEWDA